MKALTQAVAITAGRTTLARHSRMSPATTTPAVRALRCIWWPSETVDVTASAARRAGATSATTPYSRGGNSRPPSVPRPLMTTLVAMHAAIVDHRCGLTAHPRSGPADRLSRRDWQRGPGAPPGDTSTKLNATNALSGATAPRARRERRGPHHEADDSTGGRQLGSPSNSLSYASFLHLC